MSSFDFSGKTALVTGASSGLGRATAVAFGAAGANVVVASRREAESKETVRLLEQAGGHGLFVRTDVTNEDEVASLVAATVSAYGGLDFAFNNAGVEGTLGPLVEQGLENYDQVMSANVRGVFLSMKHELGVMLEAGHGAIVNNSSVAGVVGFPGAALYSASKHAVVGLTKAAALETAAAGVRINAVAPAAIQTDMLDRFAGDEENKAQLAAMHPVGRVGVPEEVAGAVLYLCSDQASFVTGHCLPVDGGFTAQ